MVLPMTTTYYIEDDGVTLSHTTYHRYGYHGTTHEHPLKGPVIVALNDEETMAVCVPRAVIEEMVRKRYKAYKAHLTVNEITVDLDGKAKRVTAKPLKQLTA